MATQTTLAKMPAAHEVLTYYGNADCCEPNIDSAGNTDLTVLYQPIQSLRPYERNARTHSKRQIRQIADSIRTFGFTNPVLVDRNNQIIAGHGRVMGAKLLHMDRVPTITLEDLTEDQIRAYILADNKLAENAGWDKGVLAIELQHLLTIEDLCFDVTVTGFEIPEIDLIIETEASLRPEVDPETAPVPDYDQPAVSRLGDIWLMGSHRVLCGSSLDEQNYTTLFATRRAAAVFTDPPYNVKIDGHATGNGSIQHREFAMASGEMSQEEFRGFLNTTLKHFVSNTTPNAIHYICMDWRHIQTLLAVGDENYDHLLNLCVWVKDNGGMGSFYRSQHELIAVFRNGSMPHRNNIQLGKFGRNRTNVWRYPGVQTLSKKSEEGNLLKLHPTVKPIEMVADALLDSTNRGDIVLDAFLGSGTTLMAAERVGRICHGIELDPRYVDTAVRRWQQYTGRIAVHEVSKKSFSGISAERS